MNAMNAKKVINTVFHACAAAIMYSFGGGIASNVYNIDPVALKSVMDSNGVELEGLITVGFGLGVLWAAAGVMFIYSVCKVWDSASEWWAQKKPA